MNFIGALFWLVVGIFICAESLRMNVGQFRNPGPGFLPFGTGLILALLASAVLVKAVREKAERGKAFWSGPGRWLKVTLTLACIFFYGLFLESLGFLLTSFFSMGFLFRVIEPQRWRTVIAGALLSAVGAYLIFETWLKVELPRGFWGI